MSWAIQTKGLRKEFGYLNPGPNAAYSDQWFDYLVSFLTGRQHNAFAMEKKHVVAVDTLDLEVRQGEFFGLLGPNGAGKTTSIKLLSTIFTPTAGEAMVNGFDLVRQPAAVKASINVVRSSGWLGFEQRISVRWNLEYWARLYGLSKQQARTRVDEVLAAVSLLDKAEDSADTLSSGQRQRLAIAKGLLVSAPILLCDEPTVALDPVTAQSVRSFLKNEVNRNNGQTVLLTTHYMHEAQQLCDRVAIMDQGRIVACDTPDRLSAAIPFAAYICQVSEVQISKLKAVKDEQPRWSITEKLGPEGSGILRVLLPEESGEGALLGVLASHGILITGVEPDKKNLEDAFMALTGRRLAA